MSQSESFATAAALSYLGYNVSSRDTGVLVDGIGTGTPASHVLKVAQIITAVNGTATPTSCALTTALHGLRPGTSARSRSSSRRSTRPVCSCPDRSRRAR